MSTSKEQISIKSKNCINIAF